MNHRFVMRVKPVSIYQGHLAHAEHYIRWHKAQVAHWPGDFAPCLHILIWLHHTPRRAATFTVFRCARDAAMEITTMILQVLIILMPLGALGAFGSDEGKLDVQRSAKKMVCGCEKFVPALAYQFCLALPGSCLARFTNLFWELCRISEAHQGLFHQSDRCPFVIKYH